MKELGHCCINRIRHNTMPPSLVADKARLVPTFCSPLSLVADKARLVPTFCAAASLVIVPTLLFFHFFGVKGLSCQEKVVNLKNN